MLQFDQLVSLNFQGLVVVFGRVAGSDSPDIYFNVLGPGTDPDSAALDWTGFTKLSFPDQVRQVGMGLITVLADAETMQPSTAPFRVVTDQKYISIVQQSARGTLYVNRFRLLKTGSGSNQKTVSYALNPAWEVRFVRSHKQDVPLDKSDTQEYLDADGKPFLEPALELSMVDAVADGNFDVALLPVAGSETLAWQFWTLAPDGTTINLFNFPPSSDGLFDITGKTLGENYGIAPDSSFTVLPEKEADPLALAGPPRAALFVKHEKVVQSDGSSIGVKRASRVMLTLPVTLNDETETVTIDSAIGNAGTMAALDGAILADAIVPAEFDLVFTTGSYLDLTPDEGDNPLAIAGPYEMHFMAAPRMLSDGLTILGGDPAADPKTAAPYVKVVDGGKLEIGFGDGTNAVSCRSLHQVLFPQTWSEITVAYGGAGANPFTLTVNDNPVPLTACTAGAEPTGAPVTTIGGASAGYEGALNRIRIAVGGADVLDLPSNAVDYSTTPPTTPNMISNGLTAEVYGPKPEPSTAPVSINTNGAFYVDAAGLSYYVGLADFIAPKDPACLIDGSDGLLHLYYRGKDDLLSVAQYSTRSARATFYADWSTDWSEEAPLALSRETVALYRNIPSEDWSHVSATVLTAPDNSQTGFVNFVAHRVGTYMNDSAIEVTGSAVSPLLCDVTVTGPEGVGTEVWTGLPRAIEPFSRIWNGAGAGNPDAQAVLTQSRPFFDYTGTTLSVLAATSAQDGYFLFTSVPGMALTLGSAAVEEGSTSDLATLAFTSSIPPKWTDGATLTHRWPDMPATARGVTDVLSGRSDSYDYTTVETPGTRAYGLPVALTRSDDAMAHVVIFVRDALGDFSATVSSGPASDRCDVEIAGYTLPDVPRDQTGFARVLNGDDTDYSYPEGYTEEIVPQIYALTNGLTASVLNATAAQTSPLAYAGLLRALYQGPHYDASTIAPMAKSPARVLQKAELVTDSGRTSVTGSRLFGAVIADPPTNGGLGRLSNTASYTNGKAPVLMPGINGGWMRVVPQFSLQNAARSASYVGFDIDKSYPPALQLAIDSDLTVESWLKPDASARGETSRLITYNETGTLNHPDLPVQYMMGTQQGPGLIVGDNTYLGASFNFTGPDLTLQTYVKPFSDTASGQIFMVSAVRGGATFLTLSVTPIGKAELSFLGGTATVTSTGTLPAQTWSCITLSVTDIGAGKVSLKLYVGDGAPVTVEAENGFSDPLGALTVGSNTGGSMQATLNGVAFWQRALSDKEVRESVLYGFPDNDPQLGIRWNLAEGAGTQIMNAAASGPDYDTKVINPASPAWDAAGAFDVPYAGRNDYVLVSNRIVKDWTHVALSSKQGWGLALDGASSGKVADGDAFNPGPSFALEAWVLPDTVNNKQIILEKPGSYSLAVTTLGQVSLTVNLTQESSDYRLPPTHFDHSVSTAIAAGKASYIAVNFTSGTVPNDSGSNEFVAQKYFVKASIYVDGQLAAENNVEDLDQPVSISNEDSAFYLGIGGARTFEFIGKISHVRVWGRTLNSAEIARVNAFHTLPASRDGLTASWDFDEQSGTVARDAVGDNDMVLSSNQLWALWQDVASAEIWVDGGASLPQRKTAADLGGYGDSQMTIGGALAEGSLTLPFTGQFDDIRLFSIRLTGTQIGESNNTPLGGQEDGLNAYWMVDAGSGGVLYDMTGKGNNGSLLPKAKPPVWSAGAAPIQNEAEYVVNALGGAVDYHSAQIAGQPSVVEYASLQTDAYGAVYSVMMRGYFYFTDVGNTELQTGYKVGDLDTVFVGQVQSKPSIVGYIEGGPPLPSENQTLAYWSGDMGGPARLYSTTSTVAYIESETKTWSFSASQSSTFKGEFNIKGGLYQVTKTGTSVGVGAEAETEALENKLKIGAKLKIGGDIGHTDGVSQSHSQTQALTASLTPSGTWEPEDNILNPTVGRRYIQNNLGAAIVKSATADLYMMALKGTQTPVGYQLIPNETIPVDTNIIDFPINPKYVKNGTLDGKVGLVNDPDYPNANAERGSYFKPVEAYALKRRIEKQEQQLAAYYDQFSTDKYRVIGSLGRVRDELGENPAFNFGDQTNQRSLCNNYVWSAGGGLRKEEQSVANSYSETYTGASSLTVAGGIEASADIGTPFGGYYIEADVLLGNTWSMTATKSASASNAFSLACTVSPTEFLSAPIMETDETGALLFKGYEKTPAPGKVDAYRYMAFLLAPAAENFTALHQVVDPNWLNNATTAAAGAMREALGDATQPWRLLYRTTYVSRVPAPFQPVRDDTTSPTITPPANVPSNYWLMAIVNRFVPSPSPTPLEIGTAIDQVLGSRATPGVLKDLIPWWESFYAKAQEYGSEEFIELAELRVDLLDYMLSAYEAAAYAES
ncbi:LamG-like jellyroll fold domain-containing protein [Salipiger abyssi]|uniref:LamG-like jellyroll fold domain-containing protein n=1 Tax=Salipiger abyssi TaxID=1250539 RepID=UPI004058CF48